MSEFEEIIRYVSDYSILVITPIQLKRVYCPFFVTPVFDFPKIEKGKQYQVKKVKVNRDMQTVYIINGIAYNATHFLLRI